jgi:hypothetical protein
MIASMKRLASVLAVVALAGPALADPMTAALEHSGGILCFTRSYDAAWLKAHRGQTIREVRFAFSEIRSGAIMRMSLKGPGKPIYAFGVCEWWEHGLNRGVQDNVLDPTFKGTRGVGCHMMTDTTGVSAEEGGDFSIAWGDGRYAQVHLNGAVTGWRNFDTRRRTSFLDLKTTDSIFRLNRAPASECGELLTKFAPKAQI